MDRVSDVFVLLLLVFTGSALAAESEFALRDGDTVVFLGDSITAERTYGKIIENYTLLRFPDRQVQFVNAGVGGDTAEDGLRRLESDVFRHRPTVVTVAFGINDIGWGMKADEEHRQRHLAAMKSIVQACVSRGIRVYVCSAAITGNDPALGEDSFLQKMCDDAMRISRDNGGLVIDVQRAMREVQQAAWDASADRSLEEKRQLLHTADTIHLNELGQLAMACAILKGLEAPSEVSSAVLDANLGSVVAVDGCRVTELNRLENGLAFTRDDEGLPFNYELFYELNYRFVPVPDTLSRYMLTIRNLPDGNYRVTASGRDVGHFSAARLADGVNIASTTGREWEPGGPWVAQAWVLRSLTDARHQALIGVRQSQAWLSEDRSGDSLADNVIPVDQRLQRMQRYIARPRPWRFSVTRMEDEAAAKDGG